MAPTSSSGIEPTAVGPARACSVCGSEETGLHRKRSLQGPLRSDDLRVTDKRYGVTLELWKCAGCGFVFASGEDLGQLTELYGSLVDPAYEESQDSRALQMRWLLKKALRICPDAVDVLDVGAGSGLLVKEADALGLRAVGIEPGATLVEAALRLHGVPLFHGVLPHPSVGARGFDLVFLIDVIEHVANPVQLLRDCEAVLRNRGRIVVVTPDVSSVAARMLGKRWWHYRPAHVGYFDRNSLSRAAAEVDLVPERWTRAKWFLPVGYLAERMSRYLPVGRLNRIAQRVAPLRWCYQRAMPLNLRDSYLVFLKQRRED